MASLLLLQNLVPVVSNLECTEVAPLCPLEQGTSFQQILLCCLWELTCFLDVMTRLSFFVVFLSAASLKSALSVARPWFDHLPFDLLTLFFLSSYKILWQIRLFLWTGFALVWAG